MDNLVILLILVVLGVLTWVFVYLQWRPPICDCRHVLVGHEVIENERTARRFWWCPICHEFCGEVAK